MADTLSTDLAALRISRGADGADSDEARRPLRKLLIAAVALAAATLGFRAGYPLVEASLFRAEVSLSEIANLSPAQAAVELTSTGYVVAQRSSKVGARADGRLVKVMVAEGQQVREGAVLAVLEESSERRNLDTARARAQAARARAQAARANVTEAQLRSDRERALAQRGAAAVASAQDLEARARALVEQVRAAEAEVGSADAEVRAVEARLAMLTITAPISGTVVSKPLRPGELMVQAGAPLLELADFSSLTVETDVPEARLSRVRPGAPCEIVLDAYPSRRLRGKTLEIVPRVNRAKGTVVVKVGFVDAPEDVMPDMAARVSFLQKALDAQAIKEAPKLVVPQSAVVDRDGAKVVFVSDGDRVRMVPVRLGPAFGGGFELREGPAAGTKVVQKPPATLADGRKIKEKEASE